MPSASARSDAAGAESRDVAVLKTATRWLHLAAAPAFAVMAVATYGGDQPDLLCSNGQDASMLNGMMTMYVLMSAFHLGPWLRLISGRERNTRDRRTDIRPR
ncbi:membrane protein [Afipia sp. P52-10]|uniref:hypothetical protein n=1 Tax=Afipia sp. P52-10 TaxID=1429916 RepID=UPI0003DF1707|nr:hypothetical protein [Afipia sp. P52-10]ETR74846.1 membrane protein [Afipia sp. P52-10]